MVEKSVKKRHLNKSEWAALEQLKLAGMSVSDVAAKAGLSVGWTYKKLGQLAADPPEIRLSRQRSALEVEMARIHADLRDENPVDVERRARAFSAVLRASKELEGWMKRDTEKATLPDDEDDSPEDFRAELERRLNRIRKEIEAGRLPAADVAKGSRPDAE